MFCETIVDGIQWKINSRDMSRPQPTQTPSLTFNIYNKQARMYKANINCVQLCKTIDYNYQTTVPVNI